MAENNIKNEVLGIAWDGTGYGEDGTLWGGEFLLCTLKTYSRVFYFKPFKLLGGEKAVKEPRRVALSLMFEIFGENLPDMAFNLGFSEREVENLFKVWKKGINSPLCSSVGRLFDAVASLIGIKHVVTYEGQAAMILEDMYKPGETSAYPFEIKDNQIDWRPILLAILEDKSKDMVPTKFINTLIAIAHKVVELIGIERVCLSGGVMQNDPLVSGLKSSLGTAGFKVYTHRKVPPNDGGISLGQAVWGGLYGAEL